VVGPLDMPPWRLHTRLMGERATRRRVLIEDARRDGSYLRVTWHPEGEVFVVSTWREEVCTGAIRVPATSSADMISLLADGLADAVGSPRRAEAATGRSAPSLWTTIEDKLRTWLGLRRTAKTTLRRVGSQLTTSLRRSA
jgi:hypothetical protein